MERSVHEQHPSGHSEVQQGFYFYPIFNNMRNYFPFISHR